MDENFTHETVSLFLQQFPELENTTKNVSNLSCHVTRLFLYLSDSQDTNPGVEQPLRGQVLPPVREHSHVGVEAGHGQVAEQVGDVFRHWRLDEDQDLL